MKIHTQRLKKKIFLILLLLSVFAVIIKINNIIMPAALSISQVQAKVTSNMVIDSVLKDVIGQMGISANDFYIDSDNNTVATNTVLINSFCSAISYGINEEIKQVSMETIEVPFGAATGISFFTNRGPSIPFKIMPRGSSNVDYETSFKSVGINQTNYQVWLNIEITVQIINPFKSCDVVLSRKVALVDTLINGEVPERYMNFQN